MNAHKATWIGVLVATTLAVIAWQNTPPILLTVETTPTVARQDEPLIITFIITNTGPRPLNDVQLTVGIPEQTEFTGANVGDENWATRLAGDKVIYRARQPLPPNGNARLALWLVARQKRGGAIRLTDYQVRAHELPTPLTGTPLIVWVEVTPTPAPPSPTPSPAPTSTPPPTASPTATAAAATPTPPPAITPTPSPTSTSTATPFLTPTPNLSPEQERLGSLTVLIFVVLALVIATSSLAWLIRKRRVQ